MTPSSYLFAWSSCPQATFSLPLDDSATVTHLKSSKCLLKSYTLLQVADHPSPFYLFCYESLAVFQDLCIPRYPTQVSHCRLRADAVGPVLPKILWKASNPYLII